METFLVEVRAISCESFSGISGGRCTLASMLDSLCELTYVGPTWRRPAKSLIQCEDAAQNERVAAMSEMAFLADRQGLPKTTARIPLGHWLPPSWARILEDPDRRLVDSRPQGNVPRTYHAAKKEEWKKFLRRKVRQMCNAMLDYQNTLIEMGNKLLQSTKPKQGTEASNPEP